MLSSLIAGCAGASQQQTRTAAFCFVLGDSACAEPAAKHGAPAPPAGSAEQSRRRKRKKKGRGGVASLFAIGLGMRTNAAPCHANSPPRRRPFVRRLSYELRTALLRSMSRRPRHPPPHTQFEKAFHRAGHPQTAVARQAAVPGIPISPGGPACSRPLMARGTSSCLPSVVRWREYA